MRCRRCPSTRPPSPQQQPPFQQQQLFPASPFAATPSSPNPADLSAPISYPRFRRPPVQQAKRRKLANADFDAFVVTDGSGEALFAITPVEDAVFCAVHARLESSGTSRTRRIVMRVNSGADMSEVYVASAAKRLNALRAAYIALHRQQEPDEKLALKSMNWSPAAKTHRSSKLAQAP
ncbi:hypothetical protein HDU83_002207 [Entophlyctis luteolus]|nr:hypothetical protein HDU83_002207 [Entophlyctis luteolus]